MLRTFVVAAAAATLLGSAVSTATPAQAMDAWWDASHGNLTVQMDAAQVELVETDHPLWEWSVCGDFDRAAARSGTDLTWWDCAGWLPLCVEYVSTLAPTAMPTLVFGPTDRDPHCYPS